MAQGTAGRAGALARGLALLALAARALAGAPGEAGGPCSLDSLARCEPGALLAEFFEGSANWVVSAQLSATAGATLAVVEPAEFALLASGGGFSAAWPCGEGPFLECSVREAPFRAPSGFLVLSAPNGTVSGRVSATGQADRSGFAPWALLVAFLFCSGAGCAFGRGRHFSKCSSGSEEPPDQAGVELTQWARIEGPGSGKTP